MSRLLSQIQDIVYAYKVGVDLAFLGVVCQARRNGGSGHKDRLVDVHFEIRGAIIILLKDCDRTVEAVWKECCDRGPTKGRKPNWLQRLAGRPYLVKCRVWVRERREGKDRKR